MKDAAYREATDRWSPYQRATADFKGVTAGSSQFLIGGEGW